MAVAHETLPDRAVTSRKQSWLTIAVFGAFVLLPLVAQSLGYSPIDGGTENRTLAPRPAIHSVRELKYLPQQLEAFVNDRFGLRTQFVHANSRLRYAMGQSSVRNVVVGTDGWLFYAAEHIMEQHTGADIFRPMELEQWVKRITWMRDWLKDQGISFYIVIAPDKNSIYPEKLPQYPRRKGGTTRLDQVAERLKTSDLEFIDPRAKLLAEKAKGEIIYYQGDSHWTERGAFVAYSLLMERIRKRFPNLVELSLNDFEPFVGAPGGTDLPRLLALDADLTYSIPRIRLKKASTQQGQPVIAMRPGWGWRVTQYKTSNTTAPRLLVFGDSFTDYVLGPQMLYEAFRDPVWTHNNGATFNLDLVRDVKPDIVVLQLAERYLRLVPQEPVGHP